MPQLNAKQMRDAKPSPHDWRSTDHDEMLKRRLRASEEGFLIKNVHPHHPIFSNFEVQSKSGMTYRVEVRKLTERQFSCDCVDFGINGLGACKHVEAVLLQLEGRFPTAFSRAQKKGTTRIDITVERSRNTLVATNGQDPLPKELNRWFARDGSFRGEAPEEALAELERLGKVTLPHLRISQEVYPWLKTLRQAAERKELRRQYENKVQSGEWPPQETKAPLFPYQREGMLHLAFTERALLADEMGLGKTIQAIAACALLHRLGKAQRVLVVTPASLKGEWEEQIQRFTSLPYKVVYGARSERLRAYQSPSFFNIVNYEQMLADSLEVNQRLRPDVVVLDEAQRIKNWGTKTSQAVKRLRSRYAFVLTGTPIENKIDELHSLMDFLNPSVLGPLFRFNRDFYVFDERGRPCGYKNLEQLHERIRPYMLRRRKAEVETELPNRTDRNHFVQMTAGQWEDYKSHYEVVSKLANLAKRRPLTKQEQDNLMIHLAMMRMTCDSQYILDLKTKVSPKIDELRKILEECRENNAKVIIFSEWERMLELARDLCRKMDLEFAWHTGSVPQKRRRAEINLFKSDPACRVFLSTDSGATGLNLQVASVVINSDLPWNPAKLEQRIARAWRKNQTQPVTVINLVAENTIEHRMLDTLAHKRSLADGVLDGIGDLSGITMRSGSQNFLARLNQLVGTVPPAGEKNTPAPEPLPADRPAGFAQRAQEKLGGALVACEERYPLDGPHSVIVAVVEGNPASFRAELDKLHQDFFGPGRSDPLSPVQLQVIDRTTDETIQRLIDAGLITRTTRGVRPLLPGSDDPEVQLLSPEDQIRIKALRDKACHALRLAEVLGSANFLSEARGHLLEAALSLGRGIAVQKRMPQPETIDSLLKPPLASCWPGSMSLLREFIGAEDRPWKPLSEDLRSLLKKL